MGKKLINYLQLLGRQGIDYIYHLGVTGIFIFSTICHLPNRKSGCQRLIQQIFSVGILSLPIICLSALFIGMVLALQGYTVLVNFGAEQALGQLIALTLVKELSPVVTGLLFAGRAGSALTAEISLMKTTEQLDAMEIMAVDPIKRIATSRFWAAQISMPILSLLFTTIAIAGGYMVGVTWLGVDSGAFWANMQAAVDFKEDVFNGIVKSIFFATVVGWISIYQGFYCEPTAEGIGSSTTKTVVYSSLGILGLDFFLTAIMFSN